MILSENDLLALAILGEIEERIWTSLLLLVVVQTAVVCARMPLVEKSNHLGSRPQRRTVAMSRSRAYRTIVVERRVERHACAHACASNQPLWSDLAVYGMPAKLSHWTVGYAVNPALVYGVGYAICIDGSRARFEVRVVAVEQLMPEAVHTLQGSQTFHMQAKLIKHEVAVLMILREHIEQLYGGK